MEWVNSLLLLWLDHPAAHTAYLVLLVLAAYGALSNACGLLYGGLHAHWLLWEFPLVWAWAWACAPLGWWAWPALVPVVVLYVVMDVAFGYLNRTVRLSDIGSLPTLAGIMPGLWWAFIALVLGSTLPLLWLWTSSALPWSRWQALPLALLVAAVLHPAWYALLGSRLASTRSRPAQLMRKRGRFTQVLIDWHESRRNRVRLQREAPGPELTAALWLGQPQRRPLLVLALESFVDLRLLSGLRCSGPVIHPDLLPFLQPSGAFDQVISPAYGGNTAQPEFELLTGTPAEGACGAIEFNLFAAQARLDAWPRRLADCGFDTRAIAGSDSRFFNHAVAYPALGFQRMHFGDHDPLAYPAPGDRFITDADLFAGVLRAWDEQRAQAPERPIAWYVLGFQGHAPFTPNRERYPDVVTLDPPEPTLSLLANQSWYRTQALAAWLSALRERASDALVLISSDHQPAAPFADFGLSNKHQVPALLFDRWQRVPIDGLPQHALGRLLWRRICGQTDASDLWDAPRLSAAYRRMLLDAILPR